MIGNYLLTNYRSLTLIQVNQLDIAMVYVISYYCDYERSQLRKSFTLGYCCHG